MPLAPTLAAFCALTQLTNIPESEPAAFTNSMLLASEPSIHIAPQDARNATGPSSTSTMASAAKRQASDRFGAKGSWRWELEGSWMNDFESDNQLQGAWYASCFLVDNFSLDFGPEVAWFSQQGGNTWGAGPAFMFRWHFLARETWSVYADAGVGMMFSGSNIPQGGSSVNFTPRVGLGASFEVSTNARILTGVRWSHLSNANAADNNDGRNSVQLYAGISLPF